MTTQLASMQDLQKRLAETVQASFGALLPEEAFIELVNKHINDFYNSESLQSSISRWKLRTIELDPIHQSATQT